MTSTAVKEETVKLRPPHWVKVADLQKGSHGYNVKVQIIKVDKEDIKSNNDNKLTLVKAQVGDETGKAELQVRVDNPDFYKQGKVIAIRNGRRQIVKGHISLQVDLFGRITEEKDEIKPTGELNISEKELPRRQANNQSTRRGKPQRRPQRNVLNNRDNGNKNYRRDNRDDRDDRRDNIRDNRRDYRVDNKRRNDRQNDRNEKGNNNSRSYQGTKKVYRQIKQSYDRNKINKSYDPTPTLIKNVQPGQIDLYLKVKVIELNQIKKTLGGKQRYFLQCVFADQTGCVDASFPGYEDIQKGDTLMLKNVEAQVIDEHIQIRKGKYGSISQAHSQIKNTNTTLDISRKSYVRADQN